MVPENERIVIDPSTGGRKAVKLARFDLIPAEALEWVAKAYGYGCTKYEERNYEKGYAWGLSIGALERHLAAFKQREELDPESGLPHMAHAAWHCLTLLMFTAHFPHLDDRTQLVPHHDP